VTAAPAPSATNTWAGWILFVDTDGDGSPRQRHRGRGQGQAAFDTPVVVRSSANITAEPTSRITFRGDGTARGSDDQTLLTGTLAVCVATTQPADQRARRERWRLAAAPRCIRRDGAGACGTPGDS
jgi:hypothetical protein